MKNETRNPTKNWKLFGGLFLSMLLVFTMLASAESEDPSAGAMASAEGDVAIASTHVVVTENSASAGATARASASNGGTAVAIAEAWANFLDSAMAYAYSISTVTAGMDEIVWTEAHVEVSASADGTAYARADSTICTGENCLDPVVVNVNQDGEGMLTSTSGGAVYSFGKSDIERYCHFKLQLTDNDVQNDDRAKYFISILAWDNGFSSETTGELEQKYNIECTTEQLNLEDNYK